MDLYFLASKVGWLLAAPSTALLLGLVLSAIWLVFHPQARRIRKVFFGALAGLVIFGLFPAADLLIAPLERRFPAFEVCPIPPGDEVAGIILLGGGISPKLVRGEPFDDLNEGGDRIRYAAKLARRYEAAPILVAGGQVFPMPGAHSEAQAMSSLLLELGVQGNRIILEDKSRTTAENARFAARLARPGQWILVTSAFHMPRSIGSFRKAGLNVVAAPTDWRVTDKTPVLYRSVSANLAATDLAIKEYIGLFAYRLGGRTSSLFPEDEDRPPC